MIEEFHGCKSCGNPNPVVISMGGGMGDTCENCDPMMIVHIQPSFICPYNDIYCTWENREGHRSMCSCWGCDIKKWKGDTAFCQPNWTLIESLRNSIKKTDINRLIGILTSEKLMRKLFHSPERIPYQILIHKVK
ncbi:MAG: hypothetical protein ACRD9Q_04930 [Nitrososphaeraceae archaeon]